MKASKLWRPSDIATAANIAAALREKGIAVEERQIRLEQPIKEIGVFDVPVHLHADVDAAVLPSVDAVTMPFGWLEPVPGAVSWLQRLQRHGAKIILFTMRSNRSADMALLQDAVQYMEENSIRLFGVNRNPDQDTWTTSPKAYADVYIDDAAFGCPLIQPKGFARPCVDWKKVGPHVEHMLLSRR